MVTPHPNMDPRTEIRHGNQVHEAPLGPQVLVQNAALRACLEMYSGMKISRTGEIKLSATMTHQEYRYDTYDKGSQCKWVANS